MADDIETRRRRAAWRASHRGTKELDFLLGRYAMAKLDGMTEGELERFERLLAASDPELEGWIMARGTGAGGELARAVADVRRFHGLA